MSIFELSLSILVVLVCCTLLGVFIYTKTRDKKIITNFLEKFSEDVTKDILSVIKQTDVKEFASFEELEKNVLNKVYDDSFKLLREIASKEVENNSAFAIVIDKLTPELVNKFVDKILIKENAEETLKYNYLTEITPIMEEEDKKLQEEFSDEEKYIEDIESAEIEEEGFVDEPTEEELQELNPPREGDEEEPLDENDISMEVLDDEPKSEIVTSSDKNGNVLYYEISPNGKKKRVSKEYAISKMVEDEY